MNKPLLIVAVLAAGLPGCASAQAESSAPAERQRAAVDAHFARSSNTFNAPFFAMLQSSRQAGWNVALGENSRLRAGLVSDRAALADVLPTATPYSKRVLLSIDAEHRAGRAFAILSVGALRESGAIAGALTGTALAPMRSAKTAFSTVSLGYLLRPNVTLQTMASVGRSTGFHEADGLETQAPAVTMASLSTGLSVRRLWSDSDRLGLSLTLPTRVGEGAASVAGASLQGEDGAFAFATRRLAFAPSAQERDLEMSYSRRLGKHDRVSGALLLRMHTSGDSGRPSELLLGMRYGRRF